MRKKIEYTITDPNSRDYNKVYQIEEMSAYQAEMWCYRALGGMIQGGLQIPEADKFLEFSSETLAMIGFVNFMRIEPHILEPLLRELLDCVKIIPQEGKIHNPRPISRNNPDIEEVSTLIELRTEVLKLNLNFLKVVSDQVMKYFLGNEKQESMT